MEWIAPICLSKGRKLERWKHDLRRQIEPHKLGILSRQSVKRGELGSMFSVADKQKEGSVEGN